jgi:predicted RNA binding protein YcfA (HicA-like mRNA interferase family)
MRSQDFFQQLQQAGYVCKRVSGSHFIFSRDGRRTFPVAVHDHDVREDVVREVLKIVNMSDEVYRERCPAMRSAKLRASLKKKESEIIRVDEDGQKIQNGNRKGRRKKGNKNAQKRIANIANTNASSSSSARAESPSIRNFQTNEIT